MYFFRFFFKVIFIDSKRFLLSLWILKKKKEKMGGRIVWCRYCAEFTSFSGILSHVQKEMWRKQKLFRKQSETFECSQTSNTMIMYHFGCHRHRLSIKNPININKIKCWNNAFNKVLNNAVNLLIEFWCFLSFRLRF